MLLPLNEVPVHVPLRRPRPLRFERLRVPVWNPYSRGRLGPAKSEDRKGGEGKIDANLTNILSTDAAGGTPTRRHALGRLPTPAPSARKSATQTAQKTALCAPWEHPGGFGIRKSASNSGHSPLRGLGGGLGDASPARRGSRSRTASPPAPLAIRTAPSASVESIEPRPPQPCEVGRPKGRRRKNRRQSHNFFLAPAAPGRPPREGGPPA